MTDGANEGNGWRGRLDEKVFQIEAWKRDHEEEHKRMREELRDFTKRNDRWSGALAVLMLIIGLLGPLLAAELVQRTFGR